MKEATPIKEIPLKELPMKETPTKKAPPTVKRFEEDILEDEDWMLTHGETLKAEGMIIPDDPDRV